MPVYLTHFLTLYCSFIKGSFAIGEYIDEEAVENLQLMHLDIYYEYSLAMARKTWFLLPYLDEIILRIVQSGIQKYWEFQVRVCVFHIHIH